LPFEKKSGKRRGNGLREVGYRLKETTLGSGAEDDHEHERKQLRMEGEHLSLVSLSSRYLLIATESSFFF
jgi:hypothetical protein